MIPSHQAPALFLKSWRPRWFSGLALVLGSLAPDLEFIVPVRKESDFGHSIVGQFLFTLPVVLMLYVLTTDLVLPWLVPYLSRRWHDLAALERARGRAWAGVVISAVLGGGTHIFLDGFTHGESNGGWLVGLIPLLGRSLPSPIGSLPVYDLLQLGLSVAFGAAAFATWRSISQQRLLWSWRNKPARRILQASPRSRRRLLRWLGACAALGAAAPFFFKPVASPSIAVEFSAYGFLDGIAAGILLAATAHRLLTDRIRLVTVPAASVSQVGLGLHGPAVGT
jgi:hypothetical protein